ncbi:lateral flagellin LafA [Aeromonas simiae]|uniref:lateral flagellin LafA n=1 Tax=Aeromonas simiae TaxID=218936 RepID=UPI0005A61408|nr:lateral flagellin LafA [Aeromonas simiae]MDO2947591.1 lateral flagellin LafA [Aeromonas simiae]MDO2955151.1 lateral flagellin LafA [Aeromonas simiae]
MAISIHTNYASLVTQNQLTSTNSSLSTAMQRLGTGLRINSAADDAAGLQMATRLQAQSNGQAMGMRNAQDAISMMQTAEGAMDEMTNIAQRMKDLATQGANDTASAADRQAIADEMTELAAELVNIRDNTRFGGDQLLTDDGKFGDTVTFQIGGNSDEKLVLDASTNVQAVNALIDGAADVVEALGAGTSADFSAAMDSIADSLDTIGAARSQFGANINRLEHTISNLSNMKENTDVANGRIMDADFAAETTNMTKGQMLMQAGMSVLSKSNQMTSMVTSLLN